ncbi:MAG: hypothetical protein ACU0BB_06925 [Paracoccaceae bacterium]
MISIGRETLILTRVGLICFGLMVLSLIAGPARAGDLAVLGPVQLGVEPGSDRAVGPTDDVYLTARFGQSPMAGVVTFEGSGNRDVQGVGFQYLANENFVLRGRIVNADQRQLKLNVLLSF